MERSVSAGQGHPSEKMRKFSWKILMAETVLWFNEVFLGKSWEYWSFNGHPNRWCVVVHFKYRTVFSNILRPSLDQKNFFIDSLINCFLSPSKNTSVEFFRINFVSIDVISVDMRKQNFPQTLDNTGPTSKFFNFGLKHFFHCLTRKVIQILWVLRSLRN